jgi:serine/threonine protein kinase
LSTDDFDKPDSSDVSLFGSADPRIGKSLAGRWEVLEFLGEGSMSAVYKARDLQTGAQVVVKILHQHLLANAKSLKRFEQRAKTAVSLKNNRIAHMLDIQLTPEGQVFIVMENLKGESLEDLLAKSGHLSPDQAIDIFIQSCEALEYAHNEDILHRDLKPSNIMLVEGIGLSEEVKLVDFGIAKLLSEEGDDVKSSGYITRTREVFGSPMYMSPEQCMGKKLDARSDIYSLGCVMYETLTGKPPFVGKNVLETAYKHMNEMPKPISAERPSDRSLARLEAVIFKCLAKDANDRYQSVSQLKADLDLLRVATEADWATNANALKKTTKVKSKPVKKSSGSSSSSDRKRPPVSFEMLVFAGASVLLVFVVAVWSFSFLGSDSQEYPAFNNDLLWVVRDKKQPAEVPDFGSREEAARMDVSTIEKEKGTDCREYANALNNLVQLYVHAGHWADAVLNSTKLIETMKKVGGPVELPTAYSNLAYCHFMQGQMPEAEQAATTAVEEAEKSGFGDKPVVLFPLKILGDIYSQKNQLEKDTDVYEKLYAVVEPRKLVVPSEYAYAAAELGDVYRRREKYADAERYYRQAIETARNNFKAENMFLAKALYGLGLVLAKEGNNKEAEECFREAQPIIQKLQGPRSALAGACKKQLSEVLWKTNWISAIMMRVTDSNANSSK